MFTSHETLSLDPGPDGLPNLDWFAPHVTLDAVASIRSQPHRLACRVERRAWRRRRIKRYKA